MLNRLATAVLMGLLFTSVSFPQSSQPATAADAPVPRLIRFAGTLKLTDPANATSVRGITFSVYETKNGGAPLWTETQNVRPDAIGHYDVLLGATKASGIPAEIFNANGERWLGVRVEGQAEQARVLLVSVPYALKAGEAQSLGGHSAADFVTTETLKTEVQQQLQQPVSGTPVKSSLSAASPATSFTDSNSTQVVNVTQNGTGIGLKATAAGTAILGQSLATSGATRGLLGKVASPSGIAILGANTAISGSAAGVVGSTASPSGIGMHAISSAATGNSIGLFASVASPNGVAGVLQNNGGGKLISGQSGATHKEVFSVGGSGNVTAGAGLFTAPTGMSLEAVSGTCPVALSGLNAPVVGCTDNNISIYGYTGSTTQPAGYFVADSTGPILEGVGAGGGGFTIGNLGDFSTTGNISTDGSVTASTGLIVTGPFAQHGSVNVDGNASGVLGPSLTITNTGNGNGSAVAIDLNPMSPGTSLTPNPILRLMAQQTGTYTGDFIFYGNKYGALNNGLMELLRVSGKYGLTPEIKASVPLNFTSSVSPGATLYVVNTEPNSNNEEGIAGEANGVNGIGVQGIGDGNGGIGVAGHATTGTAVYGFSSTGYAGDFEGNVQVSGNLAVYGTLSKQAGSFKIDHPLDPTNKFLYHSFVESPDMMNIYNGMAQLDRKGEAWVTMPEWFEALNQDFRYQLTSMGKPGPKLYIASEISGNRFKISGGPANGKVSWQVTGIRHDAYADKHRIPVEVEKTEAEKRKGLSPELFPQYQQHQEDASLDAPEHK